MNAEGVPQNTDFRGKSAIYQGGALVELFQSSMVRMCNPGWRRFAAYPGLGMFNAFGVSSFVKVVVWPLGMMRPATFFLPSTVCKRIDQSPRETLFSSSSSKSFP